MNGGGCRLVGRGDWKLGSDVFQTSFQFDLRKVVKAYLSQENITKRGFFWPSDETQVKETAALNTSWSKPP